MQQNNRLYVGNLSFQTEEGTLRDTFSAFGGVTEANIVQDRETGRSRGFGFVDMPESAAETAVKALNGSTFDGRDLTVRIARPRRQYN